jgi:Ca2+-binding RTX toxin-like protein
MGNTGADVAGTQTLLGTNIVGTSIYSGTTHIGDTTAAAVFAALDTNGGGVLADNGGPVQTVALKLDLTNPAIDAATGSSTPASDARGDARQDLYGFGNDGTHFADLGAYEIVNAPPVLSFANATTSLLENTSTASAIKLADIVETDPDGGPNTLWLSGAAADKFEIINGALYLKAGATLDFESDALLSVILNATGPLSAPGAVDSSAAFDLAVGDVNDAATVALTNVHAPISETASTASRIKIADIVVTDVDGGTNVLGLTGDDAGKFEIIGHALYLKAGATLDYETNPTLDVVVTVDDATIPGTPDNSASLSLQVIDELETLTGSIRADRLTGTAGADLIIGNFGNDTINGADGNDQIRGDLGADLLTGGPIKFTVTVTDDFIYRSLLDSPATTRGHDVVVDFAEGVDRIDLSAIDASTRKSGNQDFSFVSSFTKHAGEVIYKTVDVAGTANDRTFVYADVNGDGRADFEIELKGLHTLGVGDFIL